MFRVCLCWPFLELDVCHTFTLRTSPTCSWLAAGWSQTSAAAAPSPACWWTENSPEAGSLFEMCGSAPAQTHGIKQTQGLCFQPFLAADPRSKEAPWLPPRWVCASALPYVSGGLCQSQAWLLFGCEPHEMVRCSSLTSSSSGWTSLTVDKQNNYNRE